jgi:hypothetical protein
LGYYNTLAVGNLILISEKNQINETAACLFRESDRLRDKTHSEDIAQEWGIDESEDTRHYYFCSGMRMSRRLQIMGFNKIDSESRIKLCAQRALEKSQNEIVDLESKLDKNFQTGAFGDETWNKSILEYEKKLKEYLESFDYDAYISELISAALGSNEVALRDRKNSITFRYGAVYDVSDFRDTLAVILHRSPHLNITFDVTDFIYAGYYDENEPIIENITYFAEDINKSREKIIILTEGTTDTEFLQGSLQRIEPDLVDYFAFLDLSGAKPMLSASGVIAHGIGWL